MGSTISPLAANGQATNGNFDLRGTKWLLTGASYGIGPLIARALADRGAELVLTARSAGLLGAVAGDLQKSGARVSWLTADLRDPGSYTKLVADATAAAGGKLDGLINNAALFATKNLVDTDPEFVRDMIAVNVMAPTLLTQAVLPQMIAQGSGHVINIGSVAGLVALPNSAAYAGTKAYEHNFTTSMLFELDGTGVRTSIVEPGYVDGGVWGRQHTPAPEVFGSSSMEEVAAAVVHVAENPNTIQRIVNPNPVEAGATAWATNPEGGRAFYAAYGVGELMAKVAEQPLPRTPTEATGSLKLTGS